MSTLPRSAKWAAHLCPQGRELVAQRDALADLIERFRSEVDSVATNDQPDMLDLLLMSAWHFYGGRIERHCRACVTCLHVQQAWVE